MSSLLSILEFLEPGEGKKWPSVGFLQTDFVLLYSPASVGQKHGESVEWQGSDQEAGWGQCSW